MIAETRVAAERIMASQLMPGQVSTKREKTRALGGRSLPVLLACLIVVVAVGFFALWKSGNSTVTFPTPYQAVLLANGSVYYGQLHGYGSADPVLTNVFYIVHRADPKTKQVSNVLTKLGSELHQPDRMYLQPRSIIFVETVGTHSKVAELISESNGK
ncbi:MAG: hypothetical protein ACRD6B_18520 [Bryobacteraceae bacterium]